MKRLVLAILVVAGATAGPASAADLCVGASAGCFATLQGAVDAAHDGDTIHLRHGTFAGGVTIDRSVALVGAGSHSTVIAGGGPVLTIFREPDPENLTVSIRGVTITRGVNDSAPDDEVTFGGGIFIPVKQLQGPPFNGTGATVTIDDSVITANTVTSRAFGPPGPFCGPFPCGFNTGGGIDNGGVLTITNTQVTNNTAGSTPALATVASGVSGGGIANRRASTLFMANSVVSGNRALVSEPNGQSAGAGGIGSFGALSIENSMVSDNSAEVSGSSPGEEVREAFAGGLLIGGDPSRTATIRDTLVRGNRVLSDIDRTDTLPVAFGGGIFADAPALLERTMVTDNLVRTVAGRDSAADGGGVELVETDMTIRDSLVARNQVVIEAERAAIAVGGGIANAGRLSVERTRVLRNRVSATGAGGPLPFGEPSSVLGGGIWNGSFGGPPPELELTKSVVAGNRLDGPANFVIRGGGLWTITPVTLTNTTIAGNRPDQCFGC
jgi:hypothetical protein